MQCEWLHISWYDSIIVFYTQNSKILEIGETSDDKDIRQIEDSGTTPILFMSYPYIFPVIEYSRMCGTKLYTRSW